MHWVSREACHGRCYESLFSVLIFCDNSTPISNTPRNLIFLNRELVNDCLQLMMAKKSPKEIRNTLKPKCRLAALTWLSCPLASPSSWWPRPSFTSVCEQQTQSLRRSRFCFESLRLTRHTSQASLEALIDELNADQEIDGILVQLHLASRA